MHSSPCLVLNTPLSSCAFTWVIRLTSFIDASCSPACQDGVSCFRTSSFGYYCVCPSGYQGSYCQTRGVHNQEHACMHTAIGPRSVCTLCISYLQLVDPPVGMEGHALVHLPMLPVSVPVGTRGPTARTEVHTIKNIHACIQQLVHEAYVHCVFYICSL